MVRRIIRATSLSGPPPSSLISRGVHPACVTRPVIAFRIATRRDRSVLGTCQLPPLRLRNGDGIRCEGLVSVAALRSARSPRVSAWLESDEDRMASHPIRLPLIPLGWLTRRRIRRPGNELFELYERLF